MKDKDSDNLIQELYEFNKINQRKDKGMLRGYINKINISKTTSSNNESNIVSDSNHTKVDKSKYKNLLIDSKIKSS